jgi:DNA mismatch endonuclease (patch repair protein)
MDRLDKNRRSWNMGQIKGRNTAPEMAVRSMLHRAGYRFRLHRKDLPGKPDIVLPGRKTVIFVHGCFWHRHQGCKQCYTPKSNVDFWLAKFTGNIVRDQKNMEVLRKAGWRVVVVWECELGAPEKLQKRLWKLLESSER